MEAVNKETETEVNTEKKISGAGWKNLEKDISEIVKNAIELAVEVIVQREQVQEFRLMQTHSDQESCSITEQQRNEEGTSEIAQSYKDEEVNILTKYIQSINDMQPLKESKEKYLNDSSSASLQTLEASDEGSKVPEINYCTVSSNRKSFNSLETGKNVGLGISSNHDKECLLRRSVSEPLADPGQESTNNQLLSGAYSLESLKFGEAQSEDLEQEMEKTMQVNLSRAGRRLSEWDKMSSSSISEVSLACLQDRIIQMEETQYSTSEELQATLQELTDLQEQVRELQVENEHLRDEKGVLLESLCSQTEKLEECREQICHLKQLLFEKYDDPSLEVTEREEHLVHLLKAVHSEHKLLSFSHGELSSTMQTVNQGALEQEKELLMLENHVEILKSTVESLTAKKKLLEDQLSEDKELISNHQIEVLQLKLQLQNEQQRVQELHQEREAQATSELEVMLQDARADKEKEEEKVMRLQEQLALGQWEVARLKDQLIQSQEEIMVVKNNAKTQMSDFQYKLQILEANKEVLEREAALLQDALQQAEMKYQQHLENERELTTTIEELQKSFGDTTMQLQDTQKELECTLQKHALQTEEWKQFQDDLLTTVRVANDFKTETQQNMEATMEENKELRKKIKILEMDIQKYKSRAPSRSPSHQRKESLRSLSNPFPTSDISILHSMGQELASVRKQLNSTKRGDYYNTQQLSVRSLIESIEKVKGPTTRVESSSVSLCSDHANTKSPSPHMIDGKINDIITKHACPDSGGVLTDSRTKKSTVSGEPLGTSSEGLTLTNFSTPSEPLATHPVSILTNKVDSAQRNKCVHGDTPEKKDPLAALIKGGGSKRNALLRWCQNRTVGYRDIDITNFSSSWNDGLAFCALLNTYLPHLIPYNELDSKNKRRNFTLAFQAAESIGIPTTLDINEILAQERPDWQSIMAYVTAIYRHFEN